MAFIQELLTGEETGEPTLTDLHLTGSKTVSAGSTIVVFVARWAYGLGSAGGGGCTDNLGNTYTEQHDPLDNHLDIALFTAPVTVGGTLTEILAHPTGIGTVCYHMAGCSANFDESPAVSSIGAEFENTATSTSLSSTSITISGEKLLLYGIGVGGQFETGNISGYTPPSGFTVASSRYVTGNAPSVFLSYKYGSLSSEVLTSSWTTSKWSGALHAVGAAWSSFVPQIYRVDSP